MTSSPVSEELLKRAFRFAEQQLRGSENYAITKKITAEAGNVSYEKSLDVILASALETTFPSCSVTAN